MCDVKFVSDMPEFIEELNYNLWTSFTRRGCAGNIENCFTKNHQTYDTYFWQSLDRTETGACVALQTLPIGALDTPQSSFPFRIDTGPVFSGCKSLHYFACEAEADTRRSDIVDETKLQVNN